ncbi:hypothetical protein [Magnetofaba australis]|uniref:Uncharacterized protein n=1 Tax=Magnetofaba australis IT-1 TaxID=1434232 RepID=A0A1Y2K911_9PROT|nr:hypothetical protein [Magnetofaba australis]OSM07223.1 hypothetical protein MAIT1_03847 [Magnetofaba australis IT-1]
MSGLEHGAEDLWQRNLAALRRVDAALAQQVSQAGAIEPEAASVTLFRAQRRQDLFLLQDCAAQQQELLLSLLTSQVTYHIQPSEAQRAEIADGAKWLVATSPNSHIGTLEQSDEGGGALGVLPFVFVHESRPEGLAALLKRVDLADYLLDGKLFLQCGDAGWARLAQWAGGCAQEFNHLCPEQDAQPLTQRFDAHGGLPAPELLDNTPPDDWRSGAPSAAPKLFAEGRGGRWLFLLRLPSAFSLYRYYLDQRDILQRQGVAVESMMILPGTTDRAVVARIRASGPDVVCDLYSWGKYHVSDDPFDAELIDSQRITRHIPSDITWI